MGKITGPDKEGPCSITDSDEAQAQGLCTRPRHEAQAQGPGRRQRISRYACKRTAQERIPYQQDAADKRDYMRELDDFADCAPPLLPW